MIIEHNTINKVRIENFRGGVGAIFIQRYDDESKMIARITIPPKSSIGFHQHVGDEEIIYVIEGQGLCKTEVATEVIKAGIVNYIKNGESHGITNTSDKDLILLAIILK